MNTYDITEENGVESRPAYKRSGVALAVRILSYAVCANAAIVVAVQAAQAGRVDQRFFSPFIALALMGAVEGTERLAGLRLPAAFDVSLFLFMDAALIFGGTYDFYSVVPGWDKMLHTASGFVMYFMGLCLGELLAGKACGEKRRVVIATLFAFVFSVAIAGLWELFEFAGDSLFGTNNQAWQGGLLGETADGNYIVTDPRGNGLIDSMLDMLCALGGTVAMFVPTLAACLCKPERLSAFSFVFPGRR